ncbi:MAG: permease-like cell division protein FtsX [Steroidobacteraceae bacterium]
MSTLGTWGARHLQAGLGALGRLLRQPVASTLTVIVIALALALPAGLWLFVANARTATGDLADAVTVTVYLKPGVPLDKATQLARAARERDGVAGVKLIRSDDALAEFREYSGFGAALEALENNPLPHVLDVLPKPGANGPAQIEALKRYFAAWPEVELVQVDTEWVQRFAALLELLRRALVVVAAVLGCGVLAIVGNTVRLEIDARRAEIEVTKLVGGSNAFVRRPFLYEGALYGLGGALLAWAVVGIAVAVLAGPVRELAALYGSHFGLEGLGLREVLAVIGAGMLLGLLGAWVAAARNIARIEPRA